MVQGGGTMVLFLSAAQVELGRLAYRRSRAPPG
jgi:hypothetical protein